MQQNAYLNLRFSTINVSVEIGDPVPIIFPIIPGSGRQKQHALNLGFRGRYLSFRRRLAEFWQAQLGWCWAELLLGEKKPFFSPFLQAHRCCWILVSQHKIWAHGSELFIVGSQPACLYLAGLLQPWSTIFDASHLWCCTFPTTWAELVCLEEAWLFCLEGKVKGQGKEQPS